jgi:hypothetical protein
MADLAHSGRERRASAPSITTLAGLKNETHTAVVQYFAPVVALYNIVASTAGLPTVRWHAVEFSGEERDPPVERDRTSREGVVENGRGGPAGAPNERDRSPILKDFVEVLTNRRRGNTSISTLRRIYGSDFAKGCGDNETLNDVFHKLDSPSLAKLIQDHERGRLERLLGWPDATGRPARYPDAS